MRDESYMAESGGLMDDILDQVYSAEASLSWFNRQRKKGIELRDKKQGKLTIQLIDLHKVRTLGVINLA